jgi:hypothetical protein
MTHLDASHHLACDMRGERRPCGRRVRGHFRRTAVVELRWQCGRFFEVKNRPRANPVGGLGEVTGTAMATLDARYAFVLRVLRYQILTV